MAKNKKGQIDSREARRKRRIKNVILAYIFMVVVLAAVGAGGFFAVRAVKGTIEDKKAQIRAEEEAIIQAQLAEQERLEAEAEAQREAAMAAAEEAEIIEEEVEEYSEDDLLNEVVQSCIDDMSIEDKVAGLFIVTPEQLTKTDKVTKAGDGTKEAIEKYPVGGLVYSSQNIKDADQLTEMLANTVSYSKYPVFLAASEGLGDDSILRKTLKIEAPKSAKDIGESGDANLVYESYKSIGEYMTTYGFNLDLGISADLIIDGVKSPLDGKMFSGDVTLTSNLVSSAIEGLAESSVFSAIGCFPGQGSVAANTAEGLASSDRPGSDFIENDIKVFESGIEAGADMLMVGHFSASGLTGDETTPCSMSKDIMTELLRVERQYDGVIITDSMSKKAITEYYGADEAAVKALKAGADMILAPEDFELAYNAVVDAVKDGTISEQRINDSLARVYRLKYRSTIE